MKILIADDHSVVRQGLKQHLAAEFEGVELGEAETSDEVLERVRQQRWDVIILDLSLGDKSGLSLIEDIRTLQGQARVIVFTMHPENQYAVRALKAGAMGYVSKGSPMSEVAAAVRKALRGRRYLTQSLAEHLVDKLAGGVEETPHTALSNRELQVLQMIGSGKTVKEIAEELSLSVKTISTHRCHILEKLDLRNTADLIRYAIANDLLL